MITRATAICALAAMLAACLSEESDPFDIDGVILMDSPEGVVGPRGIYVVVPPELQDPAPPDKAVGAATVIYLNKDGGTYTPGNNNSSTNRSSIINSTAFVPAWSVSASTWSSLVSCVDDLFSRFNIVVTDQDPGSALHIEAVIAGSPGDIGMPSGVGGVSPFSCGVINDSIVFAFAEVYNSVQALCETAGQEIAHSFGLDHEYLCSDPMTYLNGCGSKTFQDTNAQCGEYSARQCECGGSTQNSVQVMYNVIGAADQLAPEVFIDQPANGATVDAGFSVLATATDNDAIDRVELYIDGSLVSTDQTSPFSFTTSASLAAGSHAVEARAFDDNQLSASDTISVNVNGPAEPPDDPNDPPDDPNDPPDDPNDPPDFPDGETGAFCADGSECLSGMCASDGNDDRCTESCDPDDATSCPDGFDCLGAGGDQYVCWPGAGGGNNGADDGPDPVIGGCAAGGGGSTSAALLCLIGLLFVRRRRAA